MKKLIQFLICLAIFIYPVKAQNIVTYAGTGLGIFGGDGGAALAAQIAMPTGIATDAAGNVFIADNLNHCIRKINLAGIISTVAGTGGSPGFSGDGSAATSALLNMPWGVEVDGSGNIYIADWNNNRIRKVNSLGVISTIAGTGIGNYFGDGFAATSAQINSPTDVAVDASGNIFIADQLNHRIRKINSLGIISTVAGIGSPGYSGDGAAATAAALNYPISVAVNGSGDIFISDQSNFRIRKVNNLGIISTIAGTGISGYSGDGAAATSAQLKDPAGICLDGSGNIYIADWNNHRVRKINPLGIISTIAGTGVPGFFGDGGLATSAQLDEPSALAISVSGNIFITDEINNRIRAICPISCLTQVNAVNQQKNIFLIYPNPSKNAFTIKSESEEFILVKDELGREIEKINLNQQNNFTAQVSNLKSGVYFIIGKNTVQKAVIMN